MSPRTIYLEFARGAGEAFSEGFDRFLESQEKHLPEWSLSEREHIATGLVFLRILWVGGAMGSVGTLAAMCLARALGVLR